MRHRSLFWLAFAAMVISLGGCSTTILTLSETKTSQTVTRYVKENSAQFVEANEFYFQGSQEDPDVIVARLPGSCALFGAGWQLAEKDLAQRMTSDFLSQGKPVKVFATGNGQVEQAYILEASGTDIFAHTQISGDDCAFELLTADSVVRLKQGRRSTDGGG